MLTTFALITALAAGAAPNLDGQSLRTVMEAWTASPGETPASAPVAGQKFRVEIPFVNGEKRNMRTFQSPARWVYDDRARTLSVIVGPGEITQTNYSAFASQGLTKLPPLQSFVFNTTEDSREVFVSTNQGDKHYIDERGVRSHVASFGLAAPYEEGGASSLPKGFRPLMIHKMKLERNRLRGATDGLTLVLDGEVTDLGQQPTVFCGNFRGTLAANQINDSLKIDVTAHQCFVTTKILRVSIKNRSGDLSATWP